MLVDSVVKCSVNFNDSLVSSIMSFCKYNFNVTISTSKAYNIHAIFLHLPDNTFHYSNKIKSSHFSFPNIWYLFHKFSQLIPPDDVLFNSH